MAGSESTVQSYCYMQNNTITESCKIDCVMHYHKEGDLFVSIDLSSFQSISKLKEQFCVKLIDEDPIYCKMRDEFGLDRRCQNISNSKFRSVYDGIDFDESIITTSAISVLFDEKPVGLLTTLITPRSLFDTYQFVIKEPRGIRLAGIASIIDDLPEFIVEVGFTKINKDFRLILSRIFFDYYEEQYRYFAKTINWKLYYLIIAQGRLTDNHQTLSKDINIGAYIETKYIPFDSSIIGENYQGSKAVIKFANLLGFTHIQNAGALPSLGPIYLKKATDFSSMSHRQTFMNADNGIVIARIK